jgi:hypothetical protein
MLNHPLPQQELSETKKKRGRHLDNLRSPPRGHACTFYIQNNSSKKEKERQAGSRV